MVEDAARFLQISPDFFPQDSWVWARFGTALHFFTRLVGNSGADNRIGRLWLRVLYTVANKDARQSWSSENGGILLGFIRDPLDDGLRRKFACLRFVCFIPAAILDSFHLGEVFPPTRKFASKLIQSVSYHITRD